MDDYTRFLKAEYGFVFSESNYDFSKHASIGCGGKAKLAFFPKTIDETVALTDGLDGANARYVMLGKLTNVLPCDGVSSAIPVITTGLCGVEEHNGLIFAYAGTSAAALLRYAKEAGESGAEFLAGIPCTIGGAAYMNAGAGGKYLSEIVESVLFYSERQIMRIPVSECGYGYKQSVFMQKKGVILGVNFRLKDSSKDEISLAIRNRLLERAHLPKGKSMGCVFKNPEGESAGALIEKSGFKNSRVGGAVVSAIHANFIINDGGATAKDIKDLITQIKTGVKTRFGVALTEEIRYLT